MTGLPYAEALAEAEAALERAQRLLLEEIAGYPTPISSCDAQYIRLISDRTKIGSCLRVMEEQPFVATPRVPEAR